MKRHNHRTIEPTRRPRFCVSENPDNPAPYAAQHQAGIQQSLAAQLIRKASADQTNTRLATAFGIINPPSLSQLCVQFPPVIPDSPEYGDVLGFLFDPGRRLPFHPGSRAFCFFELGGQTGTIVQTGCIDARINNGIGPDHQSPPIISKS